MTLDELCEDNKRLKSLAIDNAGEIARLKRELADERIAFQHAAKQHEEYKIVTHGELNKRSTRIRVLVTSLKRHHGCSRWNADDDVLTEGAQ